jgi:hypothetical protein
LWGLLLLWAAPLFPAASFALAQSRDERAVRAAYVYNLLQYVDWPEQKPELVIGFEGDAANGEILRSLLNGRTSNGHPIRVVLFPTPQELRSCSLLYLSDGLSPEARQALETVHGQTVLTVGETEPFV